MVNLMLACGGLLCGHSVCRVDLTVKSEIIRRHQELEAQLDGDLHLGHVLLVTVLVPVVEVLGYFLEHHTAGR